jgi:hypothetical protein
MSRGNAIRSQPRAVGGPAEQDTFISPLAFIAVELRALGAARALASARIRGALFSGLYLITALFILVA